jgi:hypothetical protein
MKKDQEDIITEYLGVKPIFINSKMVSAQLRDRIYWTNIPILELEDKNITLNNILTDGYSEREKSRALLESDSRPLTSKVKMLHRYFNKGFNTLVFKDKNHYKAVKEHFDAHFKKKTANEIDNILLKGDINLSIFDGVRHFNKTERERLQTIPNGYCDLLSENDAACLLGDGWTVDVITHIFKGLKESNSLSETQ